MGRSVNPGMARRAQDGRCGPPGRSGCRPALPPVGRAGPAADVPAGSRQTAADHTPGIGWSAASCRSIRHRLLGIGSSPGSHESGAVTARLTMVQLGEPHGGDLGTFASALPTPETAVRATPTLSIRSQPAIGKRSSSSTRRDQLTDSETHPRHGKSPFPPSLFVMRGDHLTREPGAIFNQPCFGPNRRAVNHWTHLVLRRRAQQNGGPPSNRCWPPVRAA